MTLNILFLSITIKKRSLDLEEAIEHERIKRLYEENKDRQMTMQRYL
jgi:uncharacterized protein (TIGR02413 family)